MPAQTQAPQIDTQQVNDFLTVLKQAHGEFQAECSAKARKYRLYFMTRDRLKTTLTSIRNTIPAGTKATPVPAGVSADAFRKLIDALAAAEKLLREEQKSVKADAPAPEPVKVPVTSGPTSAKRFSRRQEAKRKLKKKLKDIYGDKKGRLRYKLYEKWAKESGAEGSPGAMWAFLNGDTVEEHRARRAAGGTSSSEAEAATDATAGAAGQPGGAAPQGAQAGGGIAATLWPTDRPIYMRPAAIVGGIAVVGVIGWLLLSSKPKKAAAPALPAKREEKQP